MPKVDPDVEKLFSRHLRNWNDALQRWEKKCKPVRDEYKKSQGRRALVADRSWHPPSFAPDRTLTDATAPIFPGTKQADEIKEKEIERRAQNCDKTIEMIKKTIERLNHARTTGTFQNARARLIGMREKPRFIDKPENKEKIERGDMIEVLKLQGDWMHIKGPSGKEGWIHKNEIMPTLPVELTSKPGVTGGEWEDEAGGARDTLNI